jgi:hypothetical protein
VPITANRKSGSGRCGGQESVSALISIASVFRSTSWNGQKTNWRLDALARIGDRMTKRKREPRPLKSTPMPMMR